jgi:hypothetical protein
MTVTENASTHVHSVPAAPDYASRKRGIMAIYLVMAAFWITIWVAMAVRALHTGHGIGIDDGVLYPCGQRMVNGQLDGIPAAPAADRWDPATMGCTER